MPPDDYLDKPEKAEVVNDVNKCHYPCYCWQTVCNVGNFTGWFNQECIQSSQIIKKFIAFLRTQRFITALISARHLSLSWARSIQSMPPSHLLNIHFNIIFPNTPRSYKRSPSLRFPHQYPLCTSPLHLTCRMSCPSHSSWVHYPNNILRGLQIIKLFVM